MKGKYITLQIRLACAKKPETGTDFFKEIEKTILEHRKIMQEFKKPAVRIITATRRERDAVLQ
jgi:hypothetical protein